MKYKTHKISKSTQTLCGYPIKSIHKGSEFWEFVDCKLCLRININELTVNDIVKAKKAIESQQPPNKVLYEDKFQIITGNVLGPKKIKFKKKGISFLKKIIKFNDETKKTKGTIKKFFGVDVNVTEDE